MSPVPSGRRAALLLGFALFASLAFAVPVGAQDTNETPTDGGNATDGAGDGNATAGDGDAAGGDGAAAGDGEFTSGVQPPTLSEGNFVRHFSLKSVEEGCEHQAGIVPCWDVNTLVVHPGDNVVIHVDMTSGVHDLTIPSLELGTPAGRSGIHDLAFTVPETVPEEGITYICSVHQEEMVGHLKLESTIGGAHTVGANTLGVHFLAYWVGVIAFAILFVVYGATFFLFKYNETRATTDHWDRSEPGSHSPRLAAIAPLLAVVIAIAAIAAIVYVAAR